MIRRRVDPDSLMSEPEPVLPEPKTFSRVRSFLWGLGIVLLCAATVMLLPAVRRGDDGQSLLLASANAAPAPAIEPAVDLPAQTERGMTFELPVVKSPALPTPTPQAAPPTAVPTSILVLLPTPTPTLVPTTVNTGANLRSGPGAEYAAVGSRRPGQVVTLVGATADGGWYQLDNGAWIAAFLVDNAPDDLPVVASN